MERIPPDKKKASSQMNWDERLKDARARRAKIMESKGSTSSLKKPVRLGPSKNESLNEPPRPKPVEPRQPPREIERPPLPPRSRRNGLVLVVFGAGILLGVGLMQFQGSVGPESRSLGEQAIRIDPSEDTAPTIGASAQTEQALMDPPIDGTVVVQPSPEATDQIVLESTTENTVAVEQSPILSDQSLTVKTTAEDATDAPIPDPVEQVISEVAIAPVSFYQVSVLFEPRDAAETLAEAFPLIIASPSLPRRVERLEPLNVIAIDVIPSVSPPPENVELNTAPPEPAVIDTLASLITSDSSELPGRTDVFPGTVSSPAPQELEDISRSDVAPVSLESAPIKELSEPDNATTTLSVRSDGVVRPIWIFAPGSVGEDVLESTRSTAEDLNLSVQATNRVGFRISTNQVRYYDSNSAVAAEQLAAKIGAVSRDFTTSGIDAQPGTLEVYLAGRTVGARSQNTASSQRAPTSNSATSLRDSVIGRIRAGLGN